MIAPVYEKATEAHSDVVFGKVKTEAEQALAAAGQITRIPTLGHSRTAPRCTA